MTDFNEKQLEELGIKVAIPEKDAEKEADV